MICEEHAIVIDIDGTVCEVKRPDQSYLDVAPRTGVVDKLRTYQARGFYIILVTSRNMRTHQGNIGRINADTAKTLFAWLEKHDIPHDEVHFGKPWPGRGGFYVDDKAIRPDEFLNKSYDEIRSLISDD